MIQSCPPVEKIGDVLIKLEKACLSYWNNLIASQWESKKLRFLNGCLFLCCLRRGVIADAPPFHVFLQGSWRPARWQQSGSVVGMVLLEASRCPLATQSWNRFGETCGLCYTFLCAEQHIYVGTYLSHLFPYIKYIYINTCTIIQKL